MRFLPRDLNVKEKIFDEERVNCGRIYDSFKVAKCLIILLVTLKSEFTRLPLRSIETTSKQKDLKESTGEEDPVDLVSSLAL